jgi:hypothetical protein
MTESGGSGGAAGQGGGGAPGGSGGSGGSVGPASVVVDAAGAAPTGSDATVDSAAGAPDDGGSVPPAAPSACPDLTAGWTPYTAAKSVQFEGSSGNGTAIVSHPTDKPVSDDHCTYSDSGGIELFRMTKNPAGIIQRCEVRVANDYKTGRNQFEGDVRVTNGDFTCVHQVFKSFMLDAFPAEGGQLRVYTGSAPVITGAFGKWVHVNTIHDTATNNIELYIDCVRRYASSARDTPGPNGFYNKYGIYGVLGKPPAGEMSQVEWKNVRYYRK